MGWKKPYEKAPPGVWVPGEGNPDARVMFIGEMPGQAEALAAYKKKDRKNFVGPAGRELERFMNGWILPPRDEHYLCNFKRTIPEGKEFILTDAEGEALEQELERVQPEVVVALGAHITKYFLGDVTMEMVHGIPHETLRPFPGFEYIVFPAYNPAAGLHSPRLQATFAYDMNRLGAYLKHKLPPAPVDVQAGRYIDYSPGEHVDVPGAFRIEGEPEDWAEVAVDTEGWLDRPWGASYAVIPYGGFVVRSGTQGWQDFRDYVQRDRPSVVMHNAIHDLAMVRTMGLDLDELGVRVDDTMIMAYLLGIEPQGLKPLAYRHAGALHDDYSDIVAVPNARIAVEWLFDLMARLPEYHKPAKLTIKQQRQRALDAGYTLDGYNAAHPPVKPTSLERARKLIGDMLAKVEDTAELRTKWANCRAREILVEEEGYLDHWDGDPPEATLDEVPLQTAVNYAGRDADLTLRVKRSLWPQIQNMGLEAAYEADIAVLPMVDRMQAVGIYIDKPRLKGLIQQFEYEELVNHEELAHMAGRPLNPNSGDQVAAWLYDELQVHKLVPTIRMKLTDSGSRFTTNDKVLEALEGTHDGVAKVQEGREIRKMIGIIHGILRYCGRDGRLHPTLRITRVETGRISAADPNLLALPKHSKRGKAIRMGLMAQPGYVLSEWDLDQIEMRVFAHDSQDERMVQAIRDGKDIHVETGAFIAGKTYEQLFYEFQQFRAEVAGYDFADDERFAAKAVNFGILMGMTPFGLLDQLHKNGQVQWELTPNDTTVGTEQVLRDWHAMYPGGSEYISRKHAEARRYGYVRDMWGRLRWLEGIHSADPYIVAEAERMAQSTPTQSGAQGILKRIMAALWPYLKQLRREGIYVEVLLAVHDALVLEHDPQYQDLIDSIMMHVMSTTVNLTVPVSAKSKLGVERWGQL
jgi:uracil-DNA glycosylase family 4